MLHQIYSFLLCTHYPEYIKITLQYFYIILTQRTLILTNNFYAINLLQELSPTPKKKESVCTDNVYKSEEG